MCSNQRLLSYLIQDSIGLISKKKIADMYCFDFLFGYVLYQSSLLFRESVKCDVSDRIINHDVVILISFLLRSLRFLISIAFTIFWMLRFEDGFLISF